MKNLTPSDPLSDPQLNFFANPEFIPDAECDEDQLKGRLRFKQNQLKTLMAVARAFDTEEDRLDRALPFQTHYQTSDLTKILKENGFETRFGLGERMSQLKAEITRLKQLIQDVQVIDSEDF